MSAPLSDMNHSAAAAAPTTTSAQVANDLEAEAIDTRNATFVVNEILRRIDPKHIEINRWHSEEDNSNRLVFVAGSEEMRTCFISYDALVSLNRILSYLLGENESVCSIPRGRAIIRMFEVCWKVQIKQESFAAVNALKLKKEDLRKIEAGVDKIQRWSIEHPEYPILRLAFEMHPISKELVLRIVPNIKPEVNFLIESQKINEAPYNKIEQLNAMLFNGPYPLDGYIEIKEFASLADSIVRHRMELQHIGLNLPVELWPKIIESNPSDTEARRINNQLEKSFIDEAVIRLNIVLTPRTAPDSMHCHFINKDNNLVLKVENAALNPKTLGFVLQRLSGLSSKITILEQRGDTIYFSIGNINQEKLDKLYEAALKREIINRRENASCETATSTGCSKAGVFSTSAAAAVPARIAQEESNELQFYFEDQYFLNRNNKEFICDRVYEIAVRYQLEYSVIDTKIDGRRDGLFILLKKFPSNELKAKVGMEIINMLKDELPEKSMWDYGKDATISFVENGSLYKMTRKVVGDNQFSIMASGSEPDVHLILNATQVPAKFYYALLIGDGAMSETASSTVPNIAQSLFEDLNIGRLRLVELGKLNDKINLDDAAFKELSKDPTKKLYRMLIQENYLLSDGKEKRIFDIVQVVEYGLDKGKFQKTEVARDLGYIESANLLGKQLGGRIDELRFNELEDHDATNAVVVCAGASSR